MDNSEIKTFLEYEESENADFRLENLFNFLLEEAKGEIGIDRDDSTILSSK